MANILKLIAKRRDDPQYSVSGNGVMHVRSSDLLKSRRVLKTASAIKRIRTTEKKASANLT